MKKSPLPQKPKHTNPFFYLLILALALSLFTFFSSDRSKIFRTKEDPEEVSLSRILQEYDARSLKLVHVKDQSVIATTQEDIKLKAIREEGVTIVDLGFNDIDNPAEIQVEDTTRSKFWSRILIGIGPFLILILFFMFLSRKAGAGGEGGPFGFGKSKAKIYDKEKHTTRFTDVAGMEEAKEDVVEVVDFLKNPKKYQAFGAKIPKGILLVGSPGTGKTMLARAIAGEADVPFFSVSGSEFVEMFVGVGASRVRDLFKTAKQSSPCLIFIDEIDAIGKQRGQGIGGGHDEREQTLNQILTEMDGFDPGTSVIVLAATNRPDVLDKALLRPGRFDRRVFADLPDLEARKKIITVHAKNKKFHKKVSFDRIASKTVGMSGADIENILNEAAIFCVKYNRKNKEITQEDLENAVEKVSIGPERKSRKFTKKEKELTAYHEVGHALAGHFCETHDPVHKISIISRGRTLGTTWFLPNEDVWTQTKQELLDQMVSLHGGRIAERIIFGDSMMTTGASNDLERISAIARRIIMTYGMGDRKKIGPVVFHTASIGFAGDDQSQQKEYSEETARLIDIEVQKIILEAEDRCENILKKHIKLLHEISKDLLKKENIYQDDFLGYFS